MMETMRQDFKRTARANLIAPSTGNAAFMARRTQQIQQAGMQRDMGGSAGGGITSINTGGNVVSSPTTVFKGEGIAARRPLILNASAFGGP